MLSGHRLVPEDPPFPTVSGGLILNSEDTDGMKPNSTTLQWRKSSHCALGDCVEVAAAPGRIVLRDSKVPDGARIVVSSSAFRALSRGLRSGTGG